MLSNDDKRELEDLTAMLNDGNRYLVGRLDERDRLRIDWPISGKTIYLESLKCEVCDEYASWVGHTTEEHREMDSE